MTVGTSPYFFNRLIGLQFVFTNCFSKSVPIIFPVGEAVGIFDRGFSGLDMFRGWQVVV